MAKITALIVILASFALGTYLYPQMPEMMASHWNGQGQVDGYLQKCYGLFLMPFISLIVFLLLVIVPKLDPLKANVEKFKKHFDVFIALITVFLFFLYILTILWSLGIEFSMNRALSPAFSVLFVYTGILLEKAKRNWFVGIKTPWTLQSDEVWEKTHKLGGKLFKIAGLVSFFGVVLPDYASFFILVPAIIFSTYTIIYSYCEFQKQNNAHR